MVRSNADHDAEFPRRQREDGDVEEVEVTDHHPTQSAPARRLGISFPRLTEIVHGRRGVTPDTALRLARVLGMSPDYWLGLQQDWDPWHAMRGARAAEIRRLMPLAG